MAEESSLPAFQTVESIVHAFGSVSMMLESTYHAVQTSFQAVLGVVSQFSKAKSHISQVLSTIAAFRAIKYLYAKFLYLFGLATNNPRLSESVWQGAEKLAGSSSYTEQDIKGSSTKWPVLVYLGLVVALPYLLWQLANSVIGDQEGEELWAQGRGDHFRAKVLYTFQPSNQEELAIREGDRILLAPKHRQPRVRGWLLGAKEGQTGLVPANYLEILGRVEVEQGADRPDILPRGTEDLEQIFSS